MQKRRTRTALTDRPVRPEELVRRAWITAVAVAAVVIAIDQITKTWAERHVADRIVHVAGTLQFALSYNRGIAFGVGVGVAPILVAIAIIAMLLAFFGRKVQLTPVSVVAVGLLLGGALGNVADRLWRGRGGAVVDFIDLQWWPVFNVADAAIVTGAAVLVLWGSRRTTGPQ